MPKRICYVHIGPPKTGTSAIQWVLKENRTELLKQGYLVPQSGQAVDGSHYSLAHKLCGGEVHPWAESAAEDFVREVQENPSEAVIISAEALTGILTIPMLTKRFLGSLADLDLEPRIVMFPRNQPQWLNSAYAHSVKSFLSRYGRDEFFSRHGYGADWVSRLDTARAHSVTLIARPYTSAAASKGIVPDFFAAIGLDAANFQTGGKRVNESVGPFTIAVADRVRATIAEPVMKLRQASRCKIAMEKYISRHGLIDSGYCGLTTDLARVIEAKCRTNNDAFSIAVWGRPWQEVFAADVGLEFAPNDYSLVGVAGGARRHLKRAVTVLARRAARIMEQSKSAVDVAWNDPERYAHHHKAQANQAT